MIERRMDALPRKFHQTKDRKIKDEIDRFATEIRKLKAQ